LVEWQDRQREMINNCMTFGQMWKHLLRRDGNTTGQSCKTAIWLF